MYAKTIGKRKPGWTRALSVRHEYATSGAARRRASAPARALAARALRVTGYREADALANLAVRGLQLGAGELKSVDTAGSESVDWDGAVHLLNGIARGDDIGERNGRQVLMKTIELNFVAGAKAPEAGIVPSTMRVMLIYDRQTNAAALTVLQVLVTNGSIYGPITSKNLENRDRFLILRDMKFSLTGSVSTNFMAAKKYGKFYQSVSLPVTFNAGDAATVADITTGSLYILVISDQDDAAAHLPTITWTCRVRYEDK